MSGVKKKIQYIVCYKLSKYYLLWYLGDVRRRLRDYDSIISCENKNFIFATSSPLSSPEWHPLLH